MAYESLIASIPAAAEAGFGIYQAAQGNKMARGLKDPKYVIPQSQQDALALARNQAGTFSPPGYDAYIASLGQIMAGTENQINRSATSANEALGAILGASGQQMKALNDYQGFAEGNYQQRQQALQAELGQMANYEDKRWATNVQAPFDRRAAAASALTGAGIQNIDTGVNDISGIIANTLKGKEDQLLLDKKQAREDERYKQFMEYLKSKNGTEQPTTDESSPFLSSVYSQGNLGTVDPNAVNDTNSWLEQAFGQYGNAYSSGEDPYNYNPNRKGSRNPQEIY